MKNFYKAGMLVLILVVPALIYLFLKTFGSNHYRIRKFIPIEVVARSENETTTYDTIWHKIPDFKAYNQFDSAVSSATFTNKIWVANFFFTRCPGICLKMTNNLLKVQDSFEEDTTVALVSFSVDTDYDTPQILQKYASKFGINTHVWTLATTKNKLDVFNLGFYGFKVPSDTVDKFLHSDKLILVDKEKIIRGFYDGTNKTEVDRLITEIKVLQHEYADTK